jgi:glycosyltransferase involved in cell wall biosynthesis
MISFIVCAYNEESEILRTISTIKRAVNSASIESYEIVIVNDGSSDETKNLIENLAMHDHKIHIINNKINVGLGSSIRLAIEVIKYDYFMVVPGDNDMPEELISLLLKYREFAETVLTLPINKEQRSKVRNLASICYQTLYMLTFGIYVNYINGPGIWCTSRVRNLNLKSSRFSIISEINVKALRTGSTFIEVPGYFQATDKDRSTITIKNLYEVVKSFIVLMVDVNLINRKKYSRRPSRVLIKF